MNYGLLRPAVAVIVCLLAGFAGAQTNGKVAKIGVLSAGAAPTEADWKQRSEDYMTLRELGWREGENLLVESRWANTQLDRLPGLAAELIAQRVDVIVASAFRPGQAASQATCSIPVVLVEQPTHFEWVINQQTARSFGMTIPQSLLLRADEVIE